MPELVSAVGVDKKHYINIVPVKDFQYHFYSQRPWVPYILEGCTDKKRLLKTGWRETRFLRKRCMRMQSREGMPAW